MTILSQTIKSKLNYLIQLLNINWLTLQICSPINQTGFSHRQITHYNDLRDLKPTGQKQEKALDKTMLDNPS